MKGRSPTLLLALVAALMLPCAAAPAAEDAAEETNPRANYWRSVRDGTTGYSAIAGEERGELIDNGGQNWRQLRNGPIAGLSPWVLAAMLFTIGTFYLLRGPIRLRERPSGVTVLRWSLAERILHWYVAVLFIVLAITGLSLLFGRAVLIPLLGKPAFAAYAQLAMYVHNFAGPFFAAGICLEIVAWLKYNIPNRTDWQWFRKGGGMVGDAHPHAGRMNGGEKAWFWIICTVGVAAVVSGFVLDFPIFGQNRETMQQAHVVHVVAAVLWMAVALGHIYIGTIGTEGALEGMTRGRVSREWALQHHDLWYREQHAGNGGQTALQRPTVDDD